MISLDNVENYYDLIVDIYCENEPFPSELEEQLEENELKEGKYYVVDDNDNIVEEIDSDYLHYLINGIYP